MAFLLEGCLDKLVLSSHLFFGYAVCNFTSIKLMKFTVHLLSRNLNPQKKR